MADDIDPEEEKLREEIFAKLGIKNVRYWDANTPEGVAHMKEVIATHEAKKATKH